RATALSIFMETLLVRWWILNMTAVIFDGEKREQVLRCRRQADAAPGVSYCWRSALRAAERMARASALAPIARASCSVPTSVPATTLAVDRDACGKVDCTRATRWRTPADDAS